MSDDGGKTWRRPVSFPPDVADAIGQVTWTSDIPRFVADDSTDQVFRCGKSNTLVTEDLGRSWRVVSKTATPNLYIDPSNPNVLFSWEDGNLRRLRSRADAEWKWDTILQTDWFAAFAIDRRRPNVMWAFYAPTPADVITLYKSVDGGATWARTTDRAFFSSVKITFGEDADTLYVGKNRSAWEFYKTGESDGGVVVTRDGGSTWQSAGGFRGFLLHDFAEDTHGGIFVAGQPYFSTPFNGGPHQYVFSSRDGGASWSAHDVSSDRHPFVMGADGDDIYVGGAFGLHVSRDGAITWTQSGKDNMFVSQLLGNDTGSEPLLCASRKPKESPSLVVPRGLQKSVDHGATWSDTWPSAGQDIRGVTRDPVNPAVLYAVNFAREMWKSEDRGLTWSQKGTLHWPPVIHNFNKDATYIVVSPWRQGHILAGTQAGLQESTDGGASWTVRNDPELLCPGQPVYPCTINGLVASPSEVGVFYATTGRSVLRSDDHGQTWTPYHPNSLHNAYVLSLRLSHDRRRLIAATNGGLYSISADPVLPSRRRAVRR